MQSPVRGNPVTWLSSTALKFPALTVAIWLALSAVLVVVPPSLEEVGRRVSAPASRPRPPP